ncbi:MAG: exo-alpha-sialidase [Bryobacteraceae bacterium]|nr:exo-alpha-sialidase [Bryobacteraceae bacterium]
MLLLPLAALAAAGAPSAEFIYETASFPSCHASTLVETGPGELMAAWFGGTREGAKDVAIWGAHRRAGKWSQPVELVREPNTPTWNPVLFRDGKGTFWLYYKFGPSPREWSAGRMSSVDRGLTWSKPEHLPAGILGPVKNKPLVLKDGTIVSGTSVESYHAWTSWVERSTDHGRSWSKHGPVVYPGETFASIQPAIVALKGGSTLRMYVRTTEKLGRIGYSDSADGGRTWTDLRLLQLPNPNSGIDAVSLADGRIALVYNHTTEGRSPLNVAISSDGLAFQQLATLESEPGEFSYPAIVQSSAGSLHITYTWNRKKVKHAEISAASLRKGEQR